MDPYFITTAIDYTNGAPHIGHAYEKILGDVLARFQRLRGRDVFFLTGVDQHGQKVQQAAEKQGISPQAFTDKISLHFIELWQQLAISYDAWAATTEERHRRVVQQILNDLVDRDWLYKASYQGHYSIRQEQFLTDKERGEDGSFGPEWGEVIFFEEENWYFRLSRCKTWLLQFLEKYPHFVVPEFRRSELQNAAAKIVGDLCISRPKERLSWGIEFPFDPNFVTYVWFDALINYISFAGYSSKEPAEKAHFEKYWPCDHHLIGKDIMAPAHGIYWPCMLHAMGFSDDQMPQLLVHGFWNSRGEKMSKSLGNSVDPKLLVDRYGPSAFRYYMMRDIVMGRDADFNEERLVNRYNTELSNGLGNLVQRTLSMVHRYRSGSLKNLLSTNTANNSVAPSAPCSSSVLATLKTGSENLSLTPSAHSQQDLISIQEYCQQMETSQVHAALETIVNLLYRANAFVDATAPWKLSKDPAAAAQLDSVLITLLQSARVAATLLLPIIPQAAEEILRQLALEPVSLISPMTLPSFPEHYIAGQPTPIFPKIDFLPNSTAAANCCVTPVLASSSTSCTLRVCAPETPCTSSPAANFTKSLLILEEEKTALG
jgi:methionyl-tRNA synthetase